MPDEKEIQQEMEEFIAHASGKADEPAEESSTTPIEETVVDKPEDKPEDKPITQPTDKEISSASESKLDEYWEVLSEASVEIPEVIKTGKKDDGSPLTKQEKAELLRQYFLDLSQLGATEEDDLLVRDYIQSSLSPDFNRKQWFKERAEQSDLMSLPNKEFMRHILKSQAKQNKFDWTDEDIESKLNSMSKVDLDVQANQYKANYQAYQQQRQMEQQKVVLEQKQKQIEENNKTITEGVNQWVNKNRDKRKLGGFEFDEAEADELFKELPDFMTKKPVDLPDGSKGFYSEADLTHAKLLSDDEMAMRFSIYLLLVKKGKLEGFLSDKLEQKKKQIEKTLADSPEDDSRGLSGDAAFDKRAYIRAAQGRG